MKRLALTLALLLIAAPLVARTPADSTRTLERVGFSQNLGAQAPLDLLFRDERGGRLACAGC